MRRIFFSLAIVLAGALPVLASDWVPEGGLRIQRNNDGAAASQYSWPPPQPDNTNPPASEAPQAAAVPAGSAEFTLDVTQFNASHSPMPSAAPPVLPINSGVGQQARTLIKRLLGRDLQVLGSRDVILLIDKSGSMGDKDCQPPAEGLRFPLRNGEAQPLISRWEWCEQELISLSRNASGALNNGMRVVLFAGDQKVYDHTNISQISQIFQNNWPEGSTNAASALSGQLEQYFSARARGEHTRPLVIAIITDGLPNSSSALKHVLIDLSRAVRDPSEVAVTFLQIGNDRKGIKLVHELDDKLVQQGALYDLVDSKDFDQLQQVGLARALVDAINKASQSVPQR